MTLRWKKIHDGSWIADRYRIVSESFEVLVGTSRSPHRSRYTLQLAGKLDNPPAVLTTTTSFADAKAIAEHYQQKSRECPVIGCRSHREFM